MFKKIFQVDLRILVLLLSLFDSYIHKSCCKLMIYFASQTDLPRLNADKCLQK